MTPYQLALLDLESSVKPEIFAHIKSIFVEDDDDDKNVEVSRVLLAQRPTTLPPTGSHSNRSGRKEIRNTSVELTWNNGSPTKSPLDSLPARGDDEGEDHELGVGSGLFADGRSWSVYSSSLKRPQRGTLSTALCVHLPLCRKIFYKHAFRPSSLKRSSSEHSLPADEGDVTVLGREASNGRTTPLLDVPLQEIIGKINVEEPAEFDRGRKLPKPMMGVREFRSSVSNPLYKNYNPLGHIKSDDEIAQEFIQNITERFNEQMRNCFDGEPVQLDPAQMIKILRYDLEKPLRKSAHFKAQSKFLAH